MLKVMKKEYMKPDMIVVSLKHRQKLLSGSPEPNGYNGNSIPTSRSEKINDEQNVW
jgi:hypothetical protein